MTFKELVHRIVDRIKNKLYFRLPNKMEVDPLRRNQNFYCTYHRDKGHSIEHCRVLKDHLEQLVRAGHLKEFVVELGNQETGQGAQPRGNPLPPPLGVIEVIHVASTGTLVAWRKWILIIVPVEDGQDTQPFEKRLKYTYDSIAFNDDDLEGMT